MNRKSVSQPFGHGRAATLVAAVAALLLLSAPSWGIDFESGEFTGSWDTTISVGGQWRMDDPDLSLIGIANGGTAYSVNGDDGNLNYDTGIVSSVAKLTTELELRYRNFGFFGRYRGFFDYENEENDRLRTPLTDEALDRVGTRSELLDAYIWLKFRLGDNPAEIRVGEQVVSWGESTFIQGGINVINPVDVSAIRVPGAELREALLPEGMVWTSFTLSRNTSVELLYLYDWEETIIDPPGTYFSSNDFVGRGGDTVFLGFGDSSDQRPFPGTDRPFLGVPRDPTVEPDDSGQYGAAFRFFVPGWGGTEFGLYFLNYHSRLPTVNGRTGSLAGAIGAGTIAGAAPTVIGTTLFFGFQAGVQAGVAAGLDPVTAGGIALATVQGGQAGGAAAASAFATDAFAQTAGYFVAYPEDIQLYGLSFNSQLGTSGIALQGEYSYHKDNPLVVDDVELLFAALGPINPGLAMFNQVGNYQGQFDTPIPGYRLLDTSQFQMTATKVFGPGLGADSSLLLIEGGYHAVHSMPSKDELRFEGPGTYVSGNEILGPAAHAGKPVEAPEHFADDSSWGYRIAGRLSYLGAIGAWNLAPRFAWQHDVSGITPGPGGAFVEGRKAFTLGIGSDYQRTWEVDLSYTVFSGAGRYNLTNDRDFVAATVKYSF